MEQYMPFIWIGFAVVLAICEALTAQLICIWFVAGAAAAAVATIFTDSVVIQVLVFLLVSALCLAITRPLVKKITKNKKVRTNADSLIGKKGILTIDVNNEKGLGQVNVGGQIWSARAADDTLLKAGQNVVVERIEGVKLIVVPADELLAFRKEEKDEQY